MVVDSPLSSDGMRRSIPVADGAKLAVIDAFKDTVKESGEVEP
jgi:hypothetical protein